MYWPFGGYNGFLMGSAVALSTNINDGIIGNIRRCKLKFMEFK